jgi:hypothetical protein
MNIFFSVCAGFSRVEQKIYFNHQIVQNKTLLEFASERRGTLATVVGGSTRRTIVFEGETKSMFALYCTSSYV